MIWGRFGGLGGCFGALAGSWGGILGGLGGLLGGLGGLLGRLGGVLGDLGRSWGHLGDPWVALSRFGLLVAGRWGRLMFQKEAKMEPKWEPKCAKIEDKTDQNRRQRLRRAEKLFKIVLEPSWVDLGSSWVPSWGHF